jgi:hypothetical protein
MEIKGCFKANYLKIGLYLHGFIERQRARD